LENHCDVQIFVRPKYRHPRTGILIFRPMRYGLIKILCEEKCIGALEQMRTLSYICVYLGAVGLWLYIFKRRVLFLMCIKRKHSRCNRVDVKCQDAHLKRCTYTRGHTEILNYWKFALFLQHNVSTNTLILFLQIGDFQK
jgi:hypothetical protein